MSGAVILAPSNAVTVQPRYCAKNPAVASTSVEGKLM